MCLIIDPTKRAKKAKEDIVCYKVIQPLKQNIFMKYLFPKYITPYRNFRISIGKTYNSKLTMRKNFAYYIEEGLHSYKYLDAISTDFLIVQCTIPKGSTYYEGTFRDDLSYASNCLRYDEIIKK